MSKQQGTAPPPGVFVPVPTFFKSTDSSSASSSVDYSKYKAAAVGRPALDLEAQSKHTLFLASNGIHGITYLGSTGEANHLNRAERRQLISSQRKTLDEAGFTNYPIMAGALTQSTEDAIEQLHDAAESGAQWSLVLAPGYFASVVNQESLRAWFLEVAEASPIPILMLVSITTSHWMTLISQCIATTIRVSATTSW
jgi:2-keto-3-deoxy-L-rhamnonate aldolase